MNNDKNADLKKMAGIKINKLKDLAADAGKATAGYIGKAKDKMVAAVDQNDDGKLDLKDIGRIREQIGEKRDQQRQEAERKKLRPLFESDLEEPDFSMPKLIHVAEKDKKHAEAEVCQGSIGHEVQAGELNVVNIYPANASMFNLRFYPSEMSEGMYYMDPYDRDLYISLEDYFDYLRVARIGELQKIAQDLGAKHFRVIYKEQSKKVEENAIKGILHGKKGVGADAEVNIENRNSQFAKIEIAAEMECIGGDPVEPKLKYFKKDPQIQSLVALRMNNNQLKRQVYTLQLSNSSSIKVKDAATINAAMVAMKVKTKVDFVSEAESESRRYFEYEIDF